MNKREREETKGVEKGEDERDDAPSTSLARHTGNSAEEVRENKRARIQTEDEGEILDPLPLHLSRYHGTTVPRYHSTTVPQYHGPIASSTTIGAFVSVNIVISHHRVLC